MTLTKERAGILVDFLNADKDRAERIVKLDPAEAVKEINAAGNDFTAEELIEFGEVAAKAQSGELDDDALEDVAGGSATVVSLVVGLTAAIASLLASRVW